VKHVLDAEIRGNTRQRQKKLKVDQIINAEHCGNIFSYAEIKAKIY